MEFANEVLIVSDSGPKDVNCTMYGIVNGDVIETYKEGHSRPNGLDLIGNDYLISAFQDKPKIKIWQFGRPSAEFRLITTPGIVSALAVSKCGRYCVAGIGTVTYIWEVNTGNLESMLKYHIQDITCVRFTSDGSCFITGGKDGMVSVFFLSDAIKERDYRIDFPKSVYTWAQHTAEVTDIHVGCMGFHSRVATASKDMTCRVYELDTGYHMCTVRMKAPLTAVTMDLCEYFLFLGSVEGNIYRINLFDTIDPVIESEDNEKQNVFVGHKKQITSLSVSRSGMYLVSGSSDKECKVWNISNFTCHSSRTQSGPVTNVITCIEPPGIKNKKYMPRLVTSNFKRVSCIEDYSNPRVRIAPQELSVFHAGAPDQYFDSRILTCSMESLERVMKTGSKNVEQLSSINNTLYSFSLTDIFDKASENESHNSDISD